ncbi:UDP-3-O-acyl-N-acetylglucosamine deacetylase [Methylocystis sp.]|uniref:UDP-3-O-acyl-N-acetylglucosamine deacetylase n=1 Tax=Methylocystis sp. TaxID=1911079 RepID=UPI00273539C2|nr:UDP-3-O-acyl-N-acetylglucosamine deacetylase [Methylocystis sp.]MDP3554148.1 UDP-3-O-acyl-N-acetylglucosamine deacetylase [Methylocystis sp.]
MRARRAARPGSAAAPAVQQTLARSFTLTGQGVHGGRPASMTLAPAGADVGIVFSVAGADIEAHWSRVDASTLRTQLAGDGASVSTVEHVMAALAALRVDNALVLLEGDEVPAMDGSARDFVLAIDEAGVVALPAPRRVLRVVRPARVSDGAGWAELRPAESGLHLDVEIAFSCPVGRQRLALDLTPETFRRELAGARSFGFVRDAERLWREGLALGANLDNTLVFDARAAINPQGERFADECVRHKMLDVVGDLALAGAPIIGAFRSYRGGHSLNLALLEAAARAGALALELDSGHNEGVSATGRSLSP